MNLFVNKNDQINNGLRSFLNYPVIYLLFQYLMNSHGKYKKFLNRFLTPIHGKRILDIGCGCADFLSFLPEDVEYVGYDLSPAYITYAKKRYGHRAKFFNQRVNDIVIQETEPFDIVLADGLLHHIDDDEAKNLFKIGHSVLCDSGYMFTADPTLVENQGFISRRISLLDRGRHVRPPQEYEELSKSVFTLVEVYVIDNFQNWPSTDCFLKCYKTHTK